MACWGMEAAGVPQAGWGTAVTRVSEWQRQACCSLGRKEATMLSKSSYHPKQTIKVKSQKLRRTIHSREMCVSLQCQWQQAPKVKVHL